MSEEVTENIGIQNIKEVVVALSGIVGAVKQAKENDGKYGLDDLALLFPQIPKIEAALKDVNQVIPEFKDLNANEAAELVALIAADLSEIADEKLQNKIEKSLLFLKAGYDLFLSFK